MRFAHRAGGHTDVVDSPSERGLAEPSRRERGPSGPSEREARRRRFDLASARAAAAEGRVAEWVGEFLASPGSDNATLAAGLAQRRHWWLGPLPVPIDHLTRLAGPEPSIECPIDPAEWNDDVELMTDELDEGWEPPPLLAEWSPEYRALLVQDGNHRLEALQREGASHAWVIAWFDDPNELDRFLARILETERSG